MMIQTLLLLLPLSAFSLDFDSDVPAAIQTQMLDDLSFISNVQGEMASPLHHQIFGETVNGQAYSQFFEGRVNSVGLSSCGGGGAVVCVQPFLYPHKMWLTNNFIRFSHPQIARLMVVFHEARHAEDDNHWSHARCPSPFLDAQGNEMRSIWTGGPLAGEPACDNTPFGSYGSSTILLKNIEHYCMNCSELVITAARMYSDDQKGRITNSQARQSIDEDIPATLEASGF